MDFKLVILVLLAYFIRPQDWVPGMAGINVMRPLMAVTLVAMFTRQRGISLRSLVKTPIDWAILAYGCYIILSAPEGQRPIATVIVFVAYYFVTSQALSTAHRLTVYLRSWLICLLVVAAMALASEYGLDITEAKGITHAVPDQPRLALNTYLFNNANSLGHSVVIAIPLAWFLLAWRQPILRKLVTLLPILLAAYCVYLTRSKGAYIVGFAVLVTSQIFGRSILFQVITLLLAITVGLEGLKTLPRMADINRVRQDEAIMGRMLAWERARLTSKDSATGEGFKNFKAIIEWEDEEIFKATHSSYVLIGAELGRYGMYFFLGVLYACLRVLVTTRNLHREEDEVSRRALFVLLLGYMASSWLIDRSYHLEYFFLAGAISAYHRRLGVEAGLVDPEGEIIEGEGGEEDHLLAEEEGLPENDSKGEPVEKDVHDPEFASHAEHDAVPGAPGGDTITSPEEVDTSEVAEEAIQEELARRWYWKQFTVIDLLLVLLLAKIVFDLWDYLLKIYFV